MTTDAGFRKYTKRRPYPKTGKDAASVFKITPPPTTTLKRPTCEDVRKCRRPANATIRHFVRNSQTYARRNRHPVNAIENEHPRQCRGDVIPDDDEKIPQRQTW